MSFLSSQSCHPQACQVLLAPRVSMLSTPLQTGRALATSKTLHTWPSSAKRSRSSFSSSSGGCCSSGTVPSVSTLMVSATMAAAVLLPSSCGSIYWDAVTLAASTPGTHPADFTRKCFGCVHVQLQPILLSAYLVDMCMLVSASAICLRISLQRQPTCVL